MRDHIWGFKDTHRSYVKVSRTTYMFSYKKIFSIELSKSSIAMGAMKFFLVREYQVRVL